MSRTCFRVILHIIFVWSHGNPFSKEAQYLKFKWKQRGNHLVRKTRLNHLARVVKWLSCVVRTYLYGAFDCSFTNGFYHYQKWEQIIYFFLVHWLWWKLPPNLIYTYTCTYTFVGSSRIANFSTIVLILIDRKHYCLFIVLITIAFDMIIHLYLNNSPLLLF